MSGTIELTPEEQTTLTNSLRLEAQGFTEAARWLRGTIRALRGIEWDEEDKERVGGLSLEHRQRLETLFRANRGRTTPPPQVVPASPLVSVNPVIRSDQIIAAQTP